MRGGPVVGGRLEGARTLHKIVGSEMWMRNVLSGVTISSGLAGEHSSMPTVRSVPFSSTVHLPPLLSTLLTVALVKASPVSPVSLIHTGAPETTAAWDAEVPGLMGDAELLSRPEARQISWGSSWPRPFAKAAFGQKSG